MEKPPTGPQPDRRKIDEIILNEQRKEAERRSVTDDRRNEPRVPASDRRSLYTPASGVVEELRTSILKQREINSLPKELLSEDKVANNVTRPTLRPTPKSKPSEPISILNKRKKSMWEQKKEELPKKKNGLENFLILP